MKSISDIVKKEKEIYNEGLDREFYNWLFRQCDFYYKRRNKKIIANLLADKHKILEIGSRAWSDWMEKSSVKNKQIDCINISENELESGKSIAEKFNVEIQFRIMDAHNMKYNKDSFDAVIGSGILHHLDLEVSINEIMRVLKPNGLAIFSEPLKMNPVGKLVRWCTPFARTANEEPLGYPQLNFLDNRCDCKMYHEQFFSVPIGIISGLINNRPDNSLNRFTFYVDEKIRSQLPFLRPYYRNVLLVLRHP